jgi:protein-S-isoprenylcysteine O-methyltransferase Ste14
MYLGMAAVLLGCSLTVGAVFTLPIAPLFMIIIEMRFIRPEEDMLRGIFGQEYTDYCARVRRWL